MGDKIISPEDFIKFFEETSGVRFIDADTGKSALEILANNKKEEKSDYDLWLEQQDESVKIEHEMGAI
ncbi:hypothetical protein A2Y83_03815 [Candidatus Falkowbacteria bacterium RBG_13_39_14]|uniref:Uncharacterized protein n=1 Tax=Candidatus Falkowbacteria bacterium RBG_13_39_14 TaxID=1797985 RepID=A0A1F5S861_9BACT|nr:MAG: hypothetical protein A2Y83_03815 [Candidatus Falkowbacteria bacterium RBG_13_39_14]